MAPVIMHMWILFFLFFALTDPRFTYLHALIPLVVFFCLNLFNEYIKERRKQDGSKKAKSQ